MRQMRDYTKAQRTLPGAQFVLCIRQYYWCVSCKPSCQPQTRLLSKNNHYSFLYCGFPFLSKERNTVPICLTYLPHSTLVLKNPAWLLQLTRSECSAENLRPSVCSFHATNPVIFPTTLYPEPLPGSGWCPHNALRMGCLLHPHRSS